MDNLQKMVNAVSELARKDRSRYHLTLGELLDTLAVQIQLAPGSGTSTAVVLDFNGICPMSVDSYRGYFADLALIWGRSTRPEDHPIADAPPMTIKRFHEILCLALDDTFLGYKGGDFVMGRDTPLWTAEDESLCGRAVISYEADIVHGRFRLITKDVD